MTSVVTLPEIELAVGALTRKWLNDYLGVQETRTPGVKKGATKRPPAGPTGWRRVDDWPVTDVKATPCVYIVSRGIPEGGMRRNANTGVIWATVPIEVAVVCGAAAKSGYDLGIMPRLYAGALVELYTQHPQVTADLSINGVTAAGIENEAPDRNGDALAYAVVRLEVDAPVAATEPYFATDPDGPGGTPRDPDTPVTSLTESITVNSLEAVA